MSTDKSHTNVQSETSLFDNNYSFCHREVLDIDKILSENIESLNSLSNNILFLLEGPNYANNQVLNYVEETKDMVAQVRPFMLQEDSKKKKLNNKNIHKEINQLRKDIERVSQEIDQLQTEKEDAISMGISYKKALNYYTTNFDFKIEMDEKVDENKYWVKLHFGDKLQFPVKFLFNQDTATVEDFDSLTLLSPDEEATLKNKYYKEQDICMVLKLLRNFALHKS